MINPKKLYVLLLALVLTLSVSSASFATNSNYSASIGTLFNANEAFVKQDMVNKFKLGSSFNMHFISAVNISGTIWTYYIKTTPAGKMGIGLAKTTDGINFTDNGLVLDVGAPGSWEDNMASFPGIWYDNGTFYLTYEGQGTGSAGDIGLATSTDGVNFTRQGRILSHNSTGWESTNIGTPSLYKVGSTWYLFYHGFDGTDCRVGVATGTSLTGLTKNAANPTINTSASGWDSGTIGKRDIIYENNYYYMVYEGSTDQPYSTAKWSSGLARSTDLINWTKYSQNPVLPQTNNTFGNDGPAWLVLGGEQWIYYRDWGNSTSRARIANELNGGGFTAEWEAESLPIQHQIGRAEADGWSANTASDPVGYLSYGPYTTIVRAGENTAVFKLMVDNNTWDNSEVAYLDVVDADDNYRLLGSRSITRKQFSSTFHYEFFIVPFYLSYNNHRIEFRVHWKDTSYMRQDKVGVITSTNIAPEAAVSVSSQSNSTDYAGTNAVDGPFTGPNSKEWASNGEMTPWIKLTWSSSKTINRVRLFDRINTTDSISAGTLSFSDGSSISVGALPNGGHPKDITFANKTVTWVKFQVTSGSGLNVGLNEFEVYP